LAADPSPLAPAPRAVGARGAIACALALAALIALAPAPARAQEVRYQLRVLNRNLAGVSVTNYGFLGNNFTSRSPSFEYPLGSGYEHLSRGGLWIGGLAITDQGEQLRVSTAAIDAPQGTNQAAETEYTPLPFPMVERSRLVTSRVYSPDAVSDQDLIAEYTDRPARSPQNPGAEGHVPLGVNVRLEAYTFGLEAAQDFAILSFRITNDGPPLRDVYVGLYTQLVSGNKGAYSRWPPTGSDPIGTWYYKKYMTWIDSLSLVAEHYCRTVNAQGQLDSATCQFFNAPPWAGSQFLGTRAGTMLPEPESLRVNTRFWNYAPGDTLRDEDAERYALMARPGADDPSPFWAGLGLNLSPLELIAVGPFPEIPPDSTIQVDFALVGGGSYDDLLRHAAFARFAFEQNYRLPSPPPSPRLHVKARDGALDLYWDDISERVSDDTSPAPGGLDFEGYRVYVGRDRNALSLVSQYDIADTTGFNTGLGAIRLPEPVIEDGDTLVYRARVPALRDGLPYFASVTAFDTGDEQIASLESGINENKTLAVPNPGPGERSGVTVYPNPYRVEAEWDRGRLVRDHWLWFANLPGRCRIKIFTLAGDLVYDVRFDGATYDGRNARGLYDPTRDLDVGTPAMSGASFAWNLISSEGQAVASGLYLFAVEDEASGKVERGKFLIVKSDREGFR
jgi:hypothetical protein